MCEQQSILSPTQNPFDRDHTSTHDQYNFTFFKEQNQSADDGEHDYNQDKKQESHSGKMFKITRPKNGLNYLNQSNGSSNGDYNANALMQQRNMTIEQVPSTLDESIAQGYSTPNRRTPGLIVSSSEVPPKIKAQAPAPEASQVRNIALKL